MASVSWLHELDTVKDAVVGMLESEQSLQHSLPILDASVLWYDTLLSEQPVQGREAVAAIFKLLRTALPDMQLTVEEVASAEDFHVLLYYTATGTHNGPLGNNLQVTSAHTSQQQQQQQQCIAPTGKAVTWTGSIVLRMQSAATESSAAPGAAHSVSMQVVQGWHSWDPLFLYQQIGCNPSTSLPHAPPAAPAAVRKHSTAMAVPDAAMHTPSSSSAASARASPEGGGSESWPDECKAVVQQYFDIYNSGDFSRLSSIVHPSYHYWGLIDLEGRQGVAGMQAMMTGWRDALTGFSIGNDWMIAAEGNRVLFRWVLKGLHTKAPLRGVPAAAGQDAQARHIFSCGVTALSLTQDGSSEQCWKIWRKVSHANGAELLRQLGVFEFHVAA